MRLYAEIINAQVDTRNIPDRKTGELRTTEVLVIHAIDADFPGRMVKISIWENFAVVAQNALKGAVLEMLFSKIRPGNNYDPLEQITVNQENVRVIKSAAAAVKEMQETLAKRTGANKNHEQATAATTQTS